jgi:hypothetical protein
LDQLPQADRTPEVIRALARFTSLHPDDIPDAFATFMALKNDPSTPSLDDIVTHGSNFYQIDPSKVPPPEKWKDSDGIEKPFMQLSPEMQSAALNKHQARTVALSLATAARLGNVLTRDGVPPDLSQALAKNLLSGSHDPEEARREAGKLFDHMVSQQSTERVSPSDAKSMLSKLLKHPSARRIAVGYLQGLDYLDALDQLFDENNLSERSSPTEISRALIDVSRNLAEKDERSYGSDSVMNVGAAMRSRVLSYLDTLAPEKAVRVRGEIADYERDEEERRRDRMAPPGTPYRTPGGEREAPQRRETPAEEQLRLLGIPLGKLACTYSFYHTIGSMGRPYTQRHALYHGVSPYSKEKGPAAYAEWSQAHARDLGDADFKAILKSARTWLRAPVLAKNVEGVVRDTQLRAALDLAIRTCDGGRYAGAVAPTVYDDLLRQLAGISDKGTLLTVREANTPVSASSPYGAGEIETTATTRNAAVSNFTNKGNTMKGSVASVELRSYATRIASTHPEIAYDLVELSARLAADEQQEGGQQQEQAQSGQQVQSQQQKQAQGEEQSEEQAQEGQQKQAAAYRALRASLIQAVAQNPKLRAPLLPVLQILKQVG